MPMGEMISQFHQTLCAGRQQVEPIKSPVLVIDDDRDTCEMVCAFLSGSYDCDAACDGHQAIEKIRTNHYSTIIADLMMPHVDGYAVISNAAVFAPATPVVVVTGLADTESAVRAMKMGAFDYITKPFDPDHLELSVRRAVSHHLLAKVARQNEQQLNEYVARLKHSDDRLSRALKELDSNYDVILGALTAALEARNVETRGHSDRVVTYSLRLARELGLDESEMKALELGALLHDIGKIGVEDKILLKPARLTSDEWVEMRRHPEKGAQIIEGIPALRPALPVITQRHERWDGRGYPAGLAGEQIDIKARIFAVADAVDAITSDRPYDKARSFEVACNELKRKAGTQFDPLVVEVFCRVSLEEWASLAKRP